MAVEQLVKQLPTVLPGLLATSQVDVSSFPITQCMPVVKAQWMNSISRFIDSLTQAQGPHRYSQQLSLQCLDVGSIAYDSVSSNDLLDLKAAGTGLISSIIRLCLWNESGTARGNDPQQRNAWIKHYSWLRDFADDLSALTDVLQPATPDGEKKLHAIADVFTVLSSIPALGAQFVTLGHKRLLRAIDRSSQFTNFGVVNKANRNDPWLRLHCSGVELIYKLFTTAEPGLDVYAHLCQDMPDFATTLRTLVMYPRRYPVPVGLPKVYLGIIFPRDKKFLEIIRLLSSPNVELWVNDKRNEIYVQQWVEVLGRWFTMHEGDRSIQEAVMPRVKELESIVSLWSYEELLDPSPSNPRFSDFYSLCVATCLVHMAWDDKYRLKSGSRFAEDILIRRTLLLLTRIDIPHLSYLGSTVVGLAAIVSTVLSSHHSNPDRLRQVHSALAAKVEQYRSIPVMNRTVASPNVIPGENTARSNDEIRTISQVT